MTNEITPFGNENLLLQISAKELEKRQADLHYNLYIGDQNVTTKLSNRLVNILSNNLPIGNHLKDYNDSTYMLANLCSASEKELLKWPNFGQKSLSELRAFLQTEYSLDIGATTAAKKQYGLDCRGSSDYDYSTVCRADLKEFYRLKGHEKPFETYLTKEWPGLIEKFCEKNPELREQFKLLANNPKLIQQINSTCESALPQEP